MSNDDAPDAVYVYRKVLSEQPDTSVTIVTVGFITNLKNLMQSGPDSLSSLNGMELIRKKVKHWVAMAGGFPEGDETNVRKDPLASQYVIDNWPTPILFSGFEIGLAIKTGLRLIEEGPEDSPVRLAYALSIPQRAYDKDGRRSWDQTAVLAAIRGIEPYYTCQRGTFITSSDGTNGWKDDPQGNHRYLIFNMHPDSIGWEIENLMMHHPKERK
jgi:inosine-uridine nucleoside N-ribohydrolase